jgi:phosphoglycolate phosphatase
MSSPAYHEADTPLTVGFDLDLTLADTSEGIIASLAATGLETGTAIDLDGARRRLGIPIQEELALYLPEAEIAPAVSIFREYMRTLGLEGARLLPGAAESVARVRELGGRSLVLTTKHTPLALSLLSHLALDIDEVIGGLHGAGKSDELRKAEAWGYVGDHVNDMREARAAGVIAIGVTTGNNSFAELRQAGASIVLATLEDLPPYIGRSLTTTN